MLDKDDIFRIKCIIGSNIAEQIPFYVLGIHFYHYITYLSFVIVIDVENYVEIKLTEAVVMRI